MSPFLKYSFVTKLWWLMMEEWIFQNEKMVILSRKSVIISSSESTTDAWLYEWCGSIETHILVTTWTFSHLFAVLSVIFHLVPSSCPPDCSCFLFNERVIDRTDHCDKCTLVASSSVRVLFFYYCIGMDTSACAIIIPVRSNYGNCVWWNWDNK